MKPLDSHEGAVAAAADEGLEARGAPSGLVPTEDAFEAPGRHGDGDGALPGDAGRALSPVRVSGVVPLGTTVKESVNGDAASSDSASMRPSEIVSRPSLDAHTAARVPDFVATRLWPGLDPDDDEATTVDPGAALNAQERDALAQRIHSALEETLPIGTPPPEPVQRAMAPDDVEAARERRGQFKRTILLGLPTARDARRPAAAELAPVGRLEAVAPAMLEPAPVATFERATTPAATGGEPVVRASVVRVVGPPTQPPPRRSRKLGSTPAPPPPSELDHDAFVLQHPIVTPESAKRVVPAAAPPPLQALSGSASQGPWPGVMLPPPPPGDRERSSFPALPGSASLPSGVALEPSGTLVRTRPPMSRREPGPALPLDELPASDPFAGFAAPPPSLLQRWLVVVVVALAVVGLCSLLAIALGFLGKTGW